jgi:hypothetical protein
MKINGINMLRSKRFFSGAADCSFMTAAPLLSFFIASRVFYSGLPPDCIKGCGESERERERYHRALRQPFIKTAHHFYRLMLITLGRWVENPVFRVIRKFNEKML